MLHRKIKRVFRLIPRIRLNKDLLLFTTNFIRRVRGGFRYKSNSDVPYPTTIMLELTNKCNLHCVTCPREYGYGKEMEMGNMPTELSFKILDEALPYLKSIGLTGMGETLFAPNLVGVAKYIKERKPSVVVFISTNANMPGFIEKVTPVLKYIDTIQVSTDGVGETYENIRQGASFQRLYDNLSALVPLVARFNVDVMFNMVITKRNYKNMPDVIQLAQRLGVKYVNYTYFNLASVTSVPINYYDFFHSEEYLKVLADTRNAATGCKQVEVTGLDFLGSPGIRKCPLMWNHFQINHNGEVPPCYAKPFPKEYSFGNVNSSTLMNVLNSPAAKSFRNHWVAGEPHRFCQKCHFVRL